MNNNIKLVSILFLSVFMLFSCNEKENKVKTTNDTDSENKVVNIDQSSVSGLWVAKNKGRWLEFYDDGTFNMGMEGKENIKGNKYEVDLAKSTITIETKKGLKIFKYRKEGENLFIKPEGKDKEMKYTLSDKKP